MNHDFTRHVAFAAAVAAGMIVPTLSANVVLDYELILHRVTRGIGNAASEHGSKAVRLPRDVESVHGNAGDDHDPAVTRWQYGGAAMMISLGAAHATERVLGGSDLSWSGFAADMSARTGSPFDASYVATMQPNRWNHLEYVFLEESRVAFSMLSSDMSVGGEWILTQYWKDYFTNTAGRFNGLNLKVDFDIGNDPGGKIDLASSSGDGIVPGLGGIAAFAGIGLARQRRR